MELLYINDKRIDLAPRNVAQTIQINDVGDIQNRRGNYSNTIPIPPTANNVKVFDMLGLSGSISSIPYVRTSVKYVVDGIELISNGNGVVKTSFDGYSLVIYSGIVDLPNLLSDSTLEDLDLSDLDHVLTSDLFVDSFDKTEGYIYSLGNYSDDKVNFSYNISEMTPSVFAHTLFNKIFTEKGYTYSGDVFASDDFRNRLVSMVRGYSRDIQVAQTNIDTDSNILNVNETDTLPVFHFGETYTYTATSDGAFRIVSNSSISIYDADSLGWQLRKNGFAILADTFGNQETGLPSTASIAIDEVVNLQSGDVISVVITGIGELSGSNYSLRYDANTTTDLFSYIESISVNIASLIGDMKQIDFVKDIMQRFGLIFRKSRLEDNYDFVRIEDLFDDFDNSIDWSSKVAETKPKVNYANSYAKNNYFKYSYVSDKSQTDNTWADGNLKMDNYNAPNSKDVLSSVFYATEEISSQARLNQWVIEEVEDVEVLLPNDDVSRMFLNDFGQNVITYTFSDTTLSTLSFSGDVSRLDFKSIYYNNELNRNYQLFSGVINDYRIVSIELSLSVVDIYGLDLFKLYYFKQLGGHYYINKVVNYIPHKTVSVDLVRVTGERGSIDGSIIAQTQGQAFGSCRSSVLGKILLNANEEIESNASGILSKTGEVTMFASQQIKSLSSGTFEAFRVRWLMTASNEIQSIASGVISENKDIFALVDRAIDSLSSGALSIHQSVVSASASQEIQSLSSGVLNEEIAPPTWEPILMGSVGYSITDVCNNTTMDATRYAIDGYLTIGAIVAIDDQGTPFNGGGLYYYHLNKGYQIDSSGEIINIQFCSGGGPA